MLRRSTPLLALLAAAPALAAALQDGHDPELARAIRERRPFDPPPAGLAVVRAAVLFRHGDRSPVRNCYDGVPGAEEEEVARWAPLIAHREDTLRELTTPAPAVVASRALHEPRGSSNPVFGHLTRRGVAQGVALGMAMRDAYAHLLDEAEAPEVHSTNFIRTIDTAKAMLAGLRAPGGPVPVHVALETAELIPNLGLFRQCEALAQLNVAIIKAPAEAAREAELEGLRAQLLEQFPGITKPGQPFNWTLYADQAHARQAWGMASSELEEVALALTQYVASRFVSRMTHPAAKQLGAGRFLADVLRRLEGRSTPLSLSCGHDISILAVLCALDAYRTPWPPYACAIAFELLAAPDGHRFVRVLRDGEPLPLGADNKPVLTLDEFRALVAALQVSDFERVCSTPSDPSAPVMKSQFWGAPVGRLLS